MPALLLAGGDSHPSYEGFKFEKRADTPQSSFAVYQPLSLDGLTALGDVCVKALYANITCSEFVRTFMKPGYRGSPGDKEFTDSICTAECQASLKNWFDSVSSACAGKTLHDGVPQRLGGYLYEGWNETCVRDPKTKEYCNDIIDGFAVVSNITQMPRDQLCSTCYVRRLAMMQASSYSVYNEDYKRELEYVYAQCGGKGPTDMPPSPNVVQQPPPTQAYCATGTRYRTTQGDTCDSIASGANLSAAALYMSNQDLVRDCRSVTAGTSLCLPLPCAIYRVNTGDSCISIESSLGLAVGSLQSYNAWINSDCSNLQPATDFYGKTICASPQGGVFTGTPANTGAQSTPTGGQDGGPGSGKGGGNDGYYRNPVAPPAGVAVAKGTTRNCGKWHVVVSGDDCGTISINEGIEFNLFVQVNPSLSAEGCSALLKPNTAVCVGPTPEWVSGSDPVTGTTNGASSTSTSSSKKSSRSSNSTSSTTGSKLGTTKTGTSSSVKSATSSSSSSRRS
ncbi:hypothetical protein B0H66DRAFT_481824 [Apodospora peruviana]|uniref:LysM domain-containing protein n=1 Tax=Apodospora peruviana TaxID=516989 RepID=A0AAE0HZ21_9PEZI|nr:hypothetical protein B0H66DRAFT_481824 [Apodospora peruviana]